MWLWNDRDSRLVLQRFQIHSSFQKPSLISETLISHSFPGKFFVKTWFPFR
ncbi:hypothetical protein LEP1GSC103_2826 [Leptospira borgpetersenii serovar Javanica str. UI 09931]|uniref:Uncharacterized protein n=1 Tax=Leptospira borgpetersenii serovar Javanica str. UI 09931 TaxID=1049767 RepID=A0AAV3JA35_LEPBO|nr:hypothetical protein LEP1GSC066_3775 [Leptospira sp. serovar Kenya str. Sh9]EMO11580.1 hypothetical protein LEP1GSC137_0593 [Leptospira borgpetersenii str. Noumea 25]EPG57302.1 hypothetical protein LEP1GSC103_2826 [Leptospira borgpetersenii serovar Javanica str. UI 09931]